MPELPEVESLARYLQRAVGRVVEKAQLGSFAALKSYDPPIDSLIGLALTGTHRRGKFLILEFGDDGQPLYLVIHLSRAGWLRWFDEIAKTPLRPGKSPVALRLSFDDGSGFNLTEAGTEKRLAVWLTNDVDSIERVSRLGIDPLDAALDLEHFQSLLTAANQQVKKALTDQTVFAGIGNSYSDDILHEARLSPFRNSSKLAADEVSRLYDAMRSQLAEAVVRSADIPAGDLKKEKKSSMRVHGKTGESCPVCGDTIREVSFATSSLQYCATCQTAGKPLADRRLSRLLK